MKPKNRKRRLNSRVADWDLIRGEEGTTQTKKTVHKSCGAILQFTKPGSLKK